MEEKSVGTRIKKLRDERAWTQEHLAEAANISERTVQRAEEGSLSAETLTAIAGAFDVAVEVITQKKKSDTFAPMTPSVFYRDAAAALEFLSKAFGFEVRFSMPGPDGKIMHAELTLGEAVIMVGSAHDKSRSPLELGGCGVWLNVIVEDVKMHHARATQAGAQIVSAPTEAHGHRRYFARDCEGYQWSFLEPV